MSKRKLDERDVSTLRKRNVALRIAVKSSPATSWRELDRVGGALLGQRNDNALSIEEALQTVEIWRLQQSELPHAIDSTASIAEILHKELNYTEQELRLLLSAVITRSVNGIADSLQQNRAVAVSVAGLCSSIGIPTWIVQLRHNATHQQLPPLAMLRMGVISMLAFFDSTYWNPLRTKHQEAHDCMLKKLKQFESDVQKRREQGAKRTRTGLKGKEEDENSGDEDEELDNPFCHQNSRLGSTHNQFALLRQSKKNKTEPKPKAEKKRKKPSLKEMATNIVRDESCPPDILFDVLLDFLVGGDFRMASSPYLLHAMDCEWPGFLPRLLVECFNLPDEARAVLLVRHLCSKSFVQQIHDPGTPLLSDELAPTAVLVSKLQYPLNSLCDNAKPDTNMHRLLLEVLREDRIPLYGLQEHGGLQTINENSDEPKSVWMRCAHWEPWAFGSLPTDSSS